MRFISAAFFCATIVGATMMVFSCKNEHKNLLPNTPAEVVVAWQRYIDLNLLDSARMLSTNYIQGYISYLDSLSMSETLEADSNPIIGLTCKVVNDTAECNFFMEDELGEKMPGRLILVKELNQWKVDQVIDIETAFPDTLSPLDEQNMFQDSLLKD